MNLKQLSVLVPVAWLSVAGCGTRFAYLPLNDASRAMAARDPASVAMFTSSRPERAYVEVGIIEAQQKTVLSHDGAEAVFVKLRAEAARRGCDGLIVLGSDDSVVGSRGITQTLTGYRATCIVYRDAPGAP